MYIVVYERSQESGICFGLRYLIEYDDKNDAAAHPQKDTIVIAEGVSLDEGNNLTAQTPEICIFANCLEEYEHITIEQLPLVEIPARSEVDKCRMTINRNNLSRIDATPYITRLKEFAKKDSMQAACLKGFLARLADEYTGQVMTW